MSANQLAPWYFSRPDSKNSQPITMRITRRGIVSPAPRRRAVTHSQAPIAPETIEVAMISPP